MAVRGGIEVRLDDTNLRRLVREFPGFAQKAIRKIAFDIERNAKLHAPVDTGFLRSSIYAVTNLSSHYKSAYRAARRNKDRSTRFREVEVDFDLAAGKYEAYVVVGAAYGVFVEFGSRNHAAQPFLTPAVEEVQDVADTALTQFFAGAR
jgi:HK97 gp10 family phage protein